MPQPKKQLTEEQKKRLIRLAKVVDSGPFGMVEYILELEDGINQKMTDLSAKDGIKGIKGDKGDRGNDGETPIKGVHYWTDSDIKEILNETIKRVTPKKGVHYFTDKEKKEFIEKVTPKKGIHYIDGKDGKSIKGEKGDPGDIKEIAPQELRNILELLEGDERLDARFIKNLPKFEDKFVNRVGLGNLPDVNVFGITIGQTIQWNGTTWVNVNSPFINLTTTQRLALTATNGMTVYDTTLNTPMIFVNGQWATFLIN